MDGNGQTPQSGPASPALTPQQFEAIHTALGSIRGRGELVESGRQRIGEYLEARANWAADAKRRRMDRPL